MRSDGLQGVTADVRPTGGGQLQILGTDGKTVRATLGSGGGPPGQPPDPANAGLNINDVNGNLLARIGVIPPQAGLEIPAGILLNDAQGNARFLASLDQNGNPTIQLFDAGGNVIWSAP